MGQHINKAATFTKKNANGFEQTLTKYQARIAMYVRCMEPITNQKNRSIVVNHALNKHKQKARELLTSEDCIRHRKQRAQDVKAIFGNIKQNKGFKTFMLWRKGKSDH